MNKNLENVIKYPSSDASASTSPAGGEDICAFLSSNLNTIRRRYSLLEVPWRRILNAIEKLMSICVAFGNKVMDTRLPQPAGCGDKYDVDSSVQCGRSMIEMLGVLAIVGVLSIGGIAGYSKAMQKWKVNKLIDEYSMMFYALLEHIDELHKLAPQNPSVAELLQELKAVPTSWKRGTGSFYDEAGNQIGMFVAQAQGNMPDRISIDILLGGTQYNDNNEQTSQAFSTQLCVSLFNDLIIPMRDFIWSATIARWKSGWINHYGTNYCTPERKCLQNMTLEYVNQLCKNYCNYKTEVCAINVSF